MEGEGRTGGQGGPTRHPRVGEGCLELQGGRGGVGKGRGDSFAPIEKVSPSLFSLALEMSLWVTDGCMPGMFVCLLFIQYISLSHPSGTGSLWATCKKA